MSSFPTVSFTIWHHLYLAIYTLSVSVFIVDSLYYVPTLNWESRPWSYWGRKRWWVWVVCVYVFVNGFLYKWELWWVRVFPAGLWKRSFRRSTVCYFVLLFCLSCFWRLSWVEINSLLGVRFRTFSLTDSCGV